MSDPFSSSTTSSGSAASWPSLDSLPSAPPRIGGPPVPPPAPPTVPPPLASSGFGRGQPPPGPPTSPARRWYVATAIVLTVAVLAGAAIVGYRAGQTADTAAPSTVPTTTPTTTTPTTSADAPATTQAPSPTTTAGPATPPTTATDPSQAAVDAEVATLARFVEQARGLKFKQPVNVRALDDSAFVARLKEVTDVDRARHAGEEQRAGDLLHALGLLPLNVDYAQAAEKADQGAVGGFYNPEDKELAVRGAEIGPFERSIIVHELTHALDDQYFDLNREFEGSKDEASFGFTALAEGNARRIETEYVDQLSSADKRKYDQAQAAASSATDLSDVPPVILALLSAPYELGEPLVRDQLASGGQATLDNDFTDAPSTSEQVLHPDKYATREVRTPVAPPPADGPLIDDGVIGELGTLLILRESDSVGGAAVAAAAGWAGDWFVLYAQGSNLCVRIDYVMDTARDLAELKSALTDWAAGQRGRTVQSPEVGKVRVTSCVPK
ncbi:MAG: hypothetical protein HYX32_05170 [Actinobacteria bacterium]|nr:hypothetical protein [Actinomycetota bacterium]